MTHEREPREFEQAVDRLERAVQDFVGSANSQISTRATRLLEEAAERLEREARRRRSRGSSSDAPRQTEAERETAGSTRSERSHSQRDDSVSRRERRRRRRHHRRSRINESGEPGYRTSKLYRDTRRRMIAGVCAGLARYFGVERWVVRCVAITGVIFMGSIVVPAYLIAMFVVPRMPYGDEVRDVVGDTGTAAKDHRSPAPELGARFSPRTSLSTAQAALDQIELKLRRMESYVTSGQYELQREIKKIDR